MEDLPGIRGHTVLTMADHFRAVHWRAYVYRLASVVALLALALALARIAGLEIGVLGMDAWAIAPILALGVALAGLVPFALHARQFSLLGDEHKRLIYVVDPESIVMRDATGASTSVPWSVVCGCIEKEWGFLLVMQPARRRWLFKRAFKPEDLDALRRLIKAKLGDAARLQESLER